MNYVVERKKITEAKKKEKAIYINKLYRGSSKTSTRDYLVFFVALITHVDYNLIRRQLFLCEDAKHFVLTIGFGENSTRKGLSSNATTRRC